jgi:cation/acetate symporter
VLFLVAVVAMGVMLWQTGSPFGTTIILLDEVVPSLGLQDFVARHNADRLASIACLAGGIASLPYLLMRSFTTPSAREARTSFFASVLFAGVLCLAAPAAVALIEAARVGADDSLSHIAEALLAVGGMTGLLAVGSALTLAIANTLSYDLYFKSLHQTASTGRRMFIARLSIMLVAGLAALAAVGEPRLMLISTSAAFSLAASAFLPVLVLGIWWKRATGEAALAAMIAGLVVCLYYMLAPHYMPFTFYETSSFLSNASVDQAAIYETLRHDFYLVGPEAKGAVLAEWDQTAREIANWWGVRGTFAAVFAVPVGFVVMIVVSLFTRAPSEDVKRFVKGLSERAA